MAAMETKLQIDLYLGGLLQFLLKPFVMLLGKLLQRNHDLTQCTEVTYLKLLGGGSLVIAYPSLLAMRANPRIKKLRLVASPSTAPFGRALGVFDEILIIRDDCPLHLAEDSLSVIQKLYRTDAIVDLEIHSRLSVIFCLLTMARNRIGAYTEDSFWRRGLATHLLFCNKSAGVYLFYDQVAGLFGAQMPAFEKCIETFRTRMNGQAVNSPVDGGDVAVAPCCSDLGRERMMRDEEWVTVLENVMREQSPRHVHLLGGKGDAARLEALGELLHKAYPATEFVNHAGKLSLEESAALLGKLKHLVCIDSALLHLARLQGVATTSFWGPTDPATRLRPRTVGLDVVRYERIACSPCVHISNVAPCRGNNLCMRFAVNPACGLDRNPTWLAEPLPGNGVAG